MFHRPSYRAALPAVAPLLLCFACNGAGSKSALISTGKRVLQSDSGLAGAGATATARRPDGGPILPAADAEVVLPFNAGTISWRIAVNADPGLLDVHFSVDTTSSIAREIDELQLDLQQKVVPQLKDRVPNVNFGVSKFADFPLAPFGSPGSADRHAETPFVLLTPITSDIAAVSSAVARLDQPLGEGGDVPEAGAEALFQIATGEGYAPFGKPLIARFDGVTRKTGGSIGGVGFRDGALRVVLHITDAPSHVPLDYGSDFPGTHSLEEAGRALKDVGAKLIGIVSGACNASDSKLHCDPVLHDQARTDLEQVALLTGSIGASGASCPTGIGGSSVPSVAGQCPLVFDVDSAGAGLSSALIDAIVMLIDGIRFQSVSGRSSDDPIGFIKAIVPIQLAQASFVEPPPKIADLLPSANPDGKPDSFVEVRSKAKLAFDVQLRNDRIPATDAEQVFRAAVEIVGDGLIMERHVLRVRIPASASLTPLADGDAGP